MTGTGTQSARQFLDAVDAACGDLAPADRARLLGGLEEHLAELSADGVDLVAELGDPVAYAAELRSAAGLPTAGPAAAGARSGAGDEGTLPAGAHVHGGPAVAAPGHGRPGGGAGVPVPPAPSGPSAGKVLLVVAAVLVGAGILVTAALLFGGLLFFSSSSSGGAVPAATVSQVPAVAVPDVVGLPADQAVTLLQQVGLDVDRTTEPSSSVSAGSILRQDPAGGTAVPPGTVVVLTVSGS